MINGIIRGQEFRISHPLLVSDTIDYQTAEFVFSEEWDGLVKFAHFRKSGAEETYDILLHEDRIAASDHMNLDDGQYEIWIHGNRVEDGEITERITTNTAEITVAKTGSLQGEPLPEIPASAAEQILGIAQEAKTASDGVLNVLQTITAEAQTLSADSMASAVYDATENIMKFGIPKGVKGDKGDRGEAGTAGISDHTLLSNRDAADQHPISAITGLQEALDAIDFEKPKFGVIGVGKSSTTLTRIYDAIGFTTAVGTDAAAGRSDFDNYAPFNRKKCVGSWTLVNGKAVFTPQAYYGDADYAEDGTMGDYVAIDVTPFFWYHEDNAGIVAVSEGYHPGWEYHPVCLDADGKPREHTYLPAYELSLRNGKAVSLPGFHPEFGAYKALWDKCRLYGDGTLADLCIMEPSDVNHYNWLLMTIEFATTNVQSVMTGATNMRYTSDTIQLSGTNVNSVILTGSAGDNYVVGQSVYIGSLYSKTPSDVGEYNTVSAIEKCTADGTVSSDGTYRKITFDGTPRTVTAASTQISSRPWITGSTNTVLGHTGSPVSNSNNKHPCKYRWLENPYGNINMTCIDLMCVRNADGDGFKLRWYYNSEYKHFGAAETSSPPAESAFTEAAGWHLLSVETDKEHYKDGYIKELSADANYPTVRVPTDTTGGSSNTYYADYASLVQSDTVRAILRGGNVYYGSTFGPCCIYANHDPSYLIWYTGAGLFIAQ